MYTIPVVVDDSGAIMASEPIPGNARRTILTPDGCVVIMPEDE